MQILSPQEQDKQLVLSIKLAPEKLHLAHLSTDNRDKACLALPDKKLNTSKSSEHVNTVIQVERVSSVHKQKCKYSSFIFRGGCWQEPFLYFCTKPGQLLFLSCLMPTAETAVSSYLTTNKKCVLPTISTETLATKTSLCCQQCVRYAVSTFY